MRRNRDLNDAINAGMAVLILLCMWFALVMLGGAK